MTSQSNEKDNLLPQEAEGQDLSLTTNEAVNESQATIQQSPVTEPIPGIPAEDPAQPEKAGEPQDQTGDSTPEPETRQEPVAEEKQEEGAEETAESETAAAEPVRPKDYRKLSPEELVEEFRQLTAEPIQYIGRAVRDLRAAFDIHLQNAKEVTSAEDSSEPRIDPSLEKAREQFDALWEEYRKKREQFSAQMAVEQKANLEERLGLIEELKNLIEKEENVSIREFHNIQTRWRKCGMVPREQSSAVWQTYQHHVERFFDYLKLNREFRDMEFERNLAEKNKLIARAEELTAEPSVKKAFEELQALHRMWKEETGPVAADQRDAIWERFSAATRAIHERRHQFLREQKEALKAHLDAKLEICAKIEELAAQGATSHDGWQKKMIEVEALKNAFRTAGMVLESRNAEIWERFKEVNRIFNQAKNNYYKDIKLSQLSNLEKKTALVEKAESLKDSTDWNATSAQLKALQSQWKGIGHVPRQKSDALWARFRAACNFFFDHMSEQRKSGDTQSQANLKAKEELMEELKAFAISEENPDGSLEALKAITARWRAIGRVPYSARSLEEKFNALADGYFSQLKINRNDIAMIRFREKIDLLAAEGNKQKFYAEMDFIRRKIDEITREVQLLRNNVEFFSSGSSDNPLVREVAKNIDRKSETLEQWKEKLSYMRQIGW